MYLVSGGRSDSSTYHSSTEQLVKGGTEWILTENSLPERMSGLRGISFDNQIFTTGRANILSKVLFIYIYIYLIFRRLWWGCWCWLWQNSPLWSRHEDIQQHCKIGTKKTWSFSECGWHEWFYLCLILNIFMIFSKQFFYLNWFWYKNIDFFYVSFSSPSSSSSSLFPTKTSIPRSETQKWA